MVRDSNVLVFQDGKTFDDKCALHGSEADVTLDAVLNGLPTIT